MAHDCAYLGIDPGLSGGLACILNDRVEICSMPLTERDLFHWLVTSGNEMFAMIERVSGYIGNAHPGSAMFKFGQSYGALRMALIAGAIPFEEVAPRTWQKSLGIPSRGKNEPKTALKNRIKGRAQQLFPNEKITLATCDALLIAEYCRRKREGRD